MEWLQFDERDVHRSLVRGRILCFTTNDAFEMTTEEIVPTRTALIAGASGLVGSHTLRRLLEDPLYETVVAVVRKPLSVTHAKLTQHVIDFDRLDEWTVETRIDDVYCCLGTTIRSAGSQEAFRRVDFEYPFALGRWALRHGALQFLLISSMGANASSRVFYNRVKGEVEDALQHLLFPSLHILRPSLLLGDRHEHRRGEGIAAAVMTGLRPMMRGPLRPYRAIEASDVARCLVNIAGMSVSGVHIYDSAQIQQIANSPR
jgi:uncharacterized protein YbjT (DUF2867 family)